MGLSVDCLQQNNFYSATYCLIKWPEEDTHSIVPKAKFSTPVEEIATGVMCKVKGFEKFLSQIVAEGTHEEMNKILYDMVGDKNEPPPIKRKGITWMAHQIRKPEVDTRNNRTKTPSRQKKAAIKAENILLVTSGPSTENTPPGSGSPSPPPSSPKPTLSLHIP